MCIPPLAQVKKIALGGGADFNTPIKITDCHTGGLEECLFCLFKCSLSASWDLPFYARRFVPDPPLIQIFCGDVRRPRDFQLLHQTSYHFLGFK